MEEFLDPSSYEKIKTQRLTKARVLWVNFALLREMNLEVPAAGMTPAFERKLIAALGYAVPQATDNPALFGPESKEFYADRYGGLGMNGNLGSGRAASAGGVQIKGIGRTPMVGTKVTDFGHAHGGASVTEGVQEAIWGEILHRELPNGANRVVAILSTGTVTNHEWGTESRALVVRVDPLRPAHFLSNPSVEGEQVGKDARRVNQVLSRLDVGEIKVLIQKAGKQYAAAYARRFYHGATSPSNFMMDGGFIDYGTQTALPDYQRIRLLDDDAPNGETKVFKTDLLHEITNDLVRQLPVALRASVPSQKEADRLFDESFDSHLRVEMLRLTGAPPELVETLRGTPEAKNFVLQLLKIAQAGQPDLIDPKGALLKREGTYDLGAILVHLTESPGDLEALIPDRSTRELLLNDHGAFIKLLKRAATKQSVSDGALETYMKLAVKTRNRSQPDLYIGTERWDHINAIIDEATEKNSPVLVQRYIDGVIERNTRDFKEASPFEVVTDYHWDPALGHSFTSVFNAKDNTHSRVLRIATNGSEASVLGETLSLEALTGAKLIYRVGHSGEARQSTAHVEKGVVEFRFPYTPGERVTALLLNGAKGNALASPVSGAHCPFSNLAGLGANQSGEFRRLPRSAAY